MFLVGRFTHDLVIPHSREVVAERPCATAPNDEGKDSDVADLAAFGPPFDQLGFLKSVVKGTWQARRCISFPAQSFGRGVWAPLLFSPL
jgi:hypothetical protein